MPEEHQDLAREFRRINSTYQKNVDLVNVGAYQPGANATVDQAIDMHESMLDFLQQGLNEAVDFDESLDDLQRVLQGTG